MVTGVPCMCMRTTGTRAAAQRRRSSGSKRPALTSFTRSAPASSAAAATSDSDTAPERVSSTGVSGAGLAGAEAAPASGRGGRRVPEATVLVPILPQDLVDLAPVDDLALEQRLGHLVQDLGVPAEEEL